MLCSCASNKDLSYQRVRNKGYSIFLFDNGNDYINNGTFRIKDKKGKIGYANKQGKIIIKPKYAFGFPFEHGKAKVTDRGQSKEVPGSNGEYHFWESDNWFYINKKGEIIKE